MTKQHLFTILGVIKEVGGKKHFASNSKTYFQDRIDKLPVGLKVKAEFFESKTTRSSSQLSYFFVLVNYLCEHTGFTPDEMYPILIEEKWGLEQKQFRGKTYSVRKSISNSARLPKHEMGELIEHTLLACEDLGIVVPSIESLGYIK